MLSENIRLVQKKKKRKRKGCTKICLVSIPWPQRAFSSLQHLDILSLFNQKVVEHLCHVCRIKIFQGKCQKSDKIRCIYTADTEQCRFVNRKVLVVLDSLSGSTFFFSETVVWTVFTRMYFPSYFLEGLSSHLLICQAPTLGRQSCPFSVRKIKGIKTDTSPVFQTCSSVYSFCMAQCKCVPLGHRRIF